MKGEDRAVHARRSLRDTTKLREVPFRARPTTHGRKLTVIPWVMTRTGMVKTDEIG